MENDKERYEAALRYATEKHEGQLRRGGKPYITHPVAVAEYVREWGCGIEYQIAGLFHDLLEDTDAAEAEILALGGADVLRAVKLLTKSEGYVMSEYVADIKADPIARVVKAADRLHNLQSALVTDDNFKRKYIRETADWYMDLHPDLPVAAKALAQSMDTPADEFDFLFRTNE